MYVVNLIPQRHPLQSSQVHAANNILQPYHFNHVLTNRIN